MEGCRMKSKKQPGKRSMIDALFIIIAWLIAICLLYAVALKFKIFFNR